jgi:hypothetical protein
LASLTTHHLPDDTSHIVPRSWKKGIFRHIRGTSKVEICESALWVGEGLETGD